MTSTQNDSTNPKPRRRTKAQREIEAVEKQARVLELRREGKTLDEIAREIGYADKSGALWAYRAALRRVLTGPVEELRAVEAERLEEATQIAIQLMNDAAIDDEVRLKAIDRLVRTADARAKLYGLYAPTKTETDLTIKEPPRLVIRYLTDHEIRQLHETTNSDEAAED